MGCSPVPSVLHWFPRAIGSGCVAERYRDPPANPTSPLRRYISLVPPGVFVIATGIGLLAVWPLHHAAKSSCFFLALVVGMSVLVLLVRLGTSPPRQRRVVRWVSLLAAIVGAGGLMTVLLLVSYDLS